MVNKIRIPAFAFVLGMLISLPLMTGCMDVNDKEVVVYAALDKEFSQPILNEFKKSTGIVVMAKYDTESTKTVGLANEIINQKNRQRADLFWNNEILHSLRLKKEGLLEVYPCPAAQHYPPSFVSKDNDWHGFAARARVLIINTDILSDSDSRPDSIDDFVDPNWQGRCAIARPLFGTTATHAAVLFSKWGEESAKSFFRELSRVAQIESGNKQVAMKVASGQYAFGLTDTDDAMIELERGAPVAIVFPDQEPDQMGTLLIPNTLCVIKDGPNTEHAKQLVDFLLTVKVEEQLANGPSAQIPLHESSTVKSRIANAEELNVMEVDFQKAADVWDSTANFLTELFPVGK